MSEILKLTIVDDISLICNLEPEEPLYYITTLYPRDVPDGDLEAWAVAEVEPFQPPIGAVAYTDVGGPPRLVDVWDDTFENSVQHARYIQETKIVMIHIYEEV